jgi:hypothetical protein
VAKFFLRQCFFHCSFAFDLVATSHSILWRETRQSGYLRSSQVAGSLISNATFIMLILVSNQTMRPCLTFGGMPKSNVMFCFRALCFVLHGTSRSRFDTLGASMSREPCGSTPYALIKRIFQNAISKLI